MIGPQARRQQTYKRYNRFLSLVQAECSYTEDQILVLLDDCPLLDDDELCEETAAEEAILILNDPDYWTMIEREKV